MPREAIASKIETAEQIAATYSRIHSTFCQNTQTEDEFRTYYVSGSFRFIFTYIL